MKNASCREKLAGEIEMIFTLQLAKALMPLNGILLRKGADKVFNVIETTVSGARELVERILERYDVRISDDWLIEGLAELDGIPDLDLI